MGEGDDTEIPMSVRLKAQRAAAKPLISQATEQSRTEALLALRTKTVAAGGSKIKAPAPVPRATVMPRANVMRKISRTPNRPPNRPRNAYEDAVDIDATMAFWTRLEEVTTVASKQL